MPKALPTRGPFLESVLGRMRERGLGARTQEAYLRWIQRFLRFHPRSLRELGQPEVQAFVEYLVEELGVSHSTRGQALSALSFLYREVLLRPLGASRQLAPAGWRRSAGAPLAREQVQAVLIELRGQHRLIAELLYGGGLRIHECLQLRVKDLDFAESLLHVRDGAGRHRRVTILPTSAREPLQQHLSWLHAQHARDLRSQAGAVPLPASPLPRPPAAALMWEWQWVFPSRHVQDDPRGGPAYRRALHASAPQRAIRRAGQLAGLHRPVTCTTLRNAFAAHQVEDGRDLRRLENLHGHRQASSTRRHSRLLDSIDGAYGPQPSRTAG